MTHSCGCGQPSLWWWVCLFVFLRFLLSLVYAKVSFAPEQQHRIVDRGDKNSPRLGKEYRKTHLFLFLSDYTLLVATIYITEKMHNSNITSYILILVCEISP